MAISEGSWIWRNGEWVPWKDATIHVLSHAVHYGSSVFEGIRCYATKQGPAIFRLPEHMRRFCDSAKIYRMEMPDEAALAEACREVVARNELNACYIRPIALRGYGSPGVDPQPNPVDIYIMCWEWGAYLGKEGLAQGVDACVSNWFRPFPNTYPAMAKAGGNYLNGQLIKMDAHANGFAEGIALGPDGMVSEGSGQNIFVVRDGTLITPAIDGTFLQGITRDAIIRFARDLGIEVREQAVPRELLYIADEVFFCGTAAEVTPVRSIDHIQVGDGHRGPITGRIQEHFFGVVRGDLPDVHGWLTPVNAAAEVGA